MFPEIATRQDVKDRASELRTQIGQVRSDLRAEIGHLRGEMGQLRAHMWKIALTVVLATASLTTFLQRML